MKLNSIMRLSLMAIFASTSLGVWTQTFDDLGFSNPNFSYGPTSSEYMTMQASQCLEGVIFGTLDVTDFGMSDRIFRDANASICEPPKPYPGTFFPDDYVFDIYGYANANASDLCVTVNFDTGTCGPNAHAQSFAYGFDQNRGAANAINYLGDVGSSLTQPFSFVVPALTDWVLVVGNNFPGSPSFPSPAIMRSKFLTSRVTRTATALSMRTTCARAPLSLSCRCRPSIWASTGLLSLTATSTSTPPRPTVRVQAAATARPIRPAVPASRSSSPWASVPATPNSGAASAPWTNG